MKNQFIYGLICLSSVLLMFTSSLVLKETSLFEAFGGIETLDLIDYETESDTSEALARKLHTSAFDSYYPLSTRSNDSMNELYLHSKWKSLPLSTINPPPDWC